MRRKVKTVEFTDEYLCSLSFDQSKTVERTHIWDSILPGFGVRLFRNDKISFYFVKRMPGKVAPTWFNLGIYPQTMLAQARAKVLDIKEKISRGEDPRPEYSANRFTNKQVTDKFLDNRHNIVTQFDLVRASGEFNEFSDDELAKALSMSPYLKRLVKFEDDLINGLKRIDSLNINKNHIDYIKRKSRSPNQFSVIAEKYIEEYMERNLAQEKTVVGYIRRELIPVWNTIPINRITHHDIAQLVKRIAELKPDKKTRGVRGQFGARQIFSIISAIFNWCFKNGIIEINPVTRLVGSELHGLTYRDVGRTKEKIAVYKMYAKKSIRILK